MPNKSISAALTAAQKTTMKTAVTANMAILQPFGVNLTDKERQKLRKVGTKRVGYVQLGLKAVQEIPGIIPPSFDKTEYGKDVTLFADTDELIIHHNSYFETLNDTHLAVGAEAMQQTDQVYDLVKNAAQRGNVAATELMKEFAKYFAGQGKKKKSGNP